MVRVRDVKEWAGLWMRGRSAETRRCIRQHAVVLECLLLSGAGTAWLDAADRGRRRFDPVTFDQ
jgi:hypothetical protein